MKAQNAKAQAAMIAAGKSYQAGVIRAMLYQRINNTVGIPNLDVSIEVQALTTALADYLNRLASSSTHKSSLVKPLVDASGVHLTNINNEGSNAAKHCNLGFICMEILQSSLWSCKCYLFLYSVCQPRSHFANPNNGKH